MLQPGHVVPRLDPQLVHQDGPQVLEHPQRLRLAATAVERQHPLRPQPLPHGVGARQRLQLAGDGLVPAERQLGVHPRLGRQQPQFLQAARLGPGERFVADLAVGRSAPELLGLGEQPHALVRMPAGQLCAALCHQAFEPEDVRRLRRDVQEIARRPRHDDVVGRAGLADALAQTRDGGAQRDLGPRPVVVAPQGVHETVDRDDDVAIDEEPGDERPRLHAPDIDGAPVPGDLDGTEHPDLQARRFTPRHDRRSPMPATRPRASRSGGLPDNMVRMLPAERPHRVAGHH